MLRVGLRDIEQPRQTQYKLLDRFQFLKRLEILKGPDVPPFITVRNSIRPSWPAMSCRRWLQASIITCVIRFSTSAGWGPL